MLKKIFVVLVILGVLGSVVLGIGLVWGYHYFTRDLPKFTSMEDYKPAAASLMYSNDGTLVGEFYLPSERRYPVPLSEIPLFVRQAFLGAEDASFYKHPGIDPVSILRAFIKNVKTGSSKQGGSTITQQVVKNLLLTREKSLERKIKEAILAYRIEHRLSKDQILEIYLNQITFGHNTFGVKAAAKVYFRKELNELTLAEAAILAGLPKAPSKYSPLRNFAAAKRRQKYVLGQMLKAGFVTDPKEIEDAYKQELKVYSDSKSRLMRAPYYIDAIQKVFAEEWKELDLERDGLKVYTALDLDAYDSSVRAMQRGLKEVDKRRGWRGPLEYLSEDAEATFAKKYASRIPTVLKQDTVYPALVVSAANKNGRLHLKLGTVNGVVDIKKATWARVMIDKNDRTKGIRPENSLRAGDVIEVSFLADDLKKYYDNKNPTALLEAALDQTPDIEGALVALDPHSGKVVTVVGGYDYDYQRSVFNRAIQAHRQPGSVFKPIVYFTAIDRHGYTPATIVYDTPKTFQIGDQVWTPGNYEKNFLGPITLRTALQKSRNLVSADIVYKIGVDDVIRTAKQLGITSPIGRNLSISLGSSEVSVLELTRAYGVFAAGGVLFPSVFVTRIEDRNGKVIFDYNAERLKLAKRVIDENSAFIMAHMMKGVVENGTGYRVKALGRPTAGKTGTTNHFMDAWFVGYTPDWACGVWAGFDEKKTIKAGETGGRVSAPIWLYFMTDFLAKQDALAYEKLVEESKQEAARLGVEYDKPEPLKPRDFDVPDGVDPYWVTKDGELTTPSTPGAILEYFRKDAPPQRREQKQQEADYWNSPEL
ncbi:MAG: penicillin-binding protein 1A [Bdellovibrionota bacterium]|jgi:penicillin-binding protein 1A